MHHNLDHTPVFFADAPVWKAILHPMTLELCLYWFERELEEALGVNHDPFLGDSRPSLPVRAATDDARQFIGMRFRFGWEPDTGKLTKILQMNEEWRTRYEAAYVLFVPGTEEEDEEEDEDDTFLADGWIFAAQTHTDRVTVTFADLLPPLYADHFKKWLGRRFQAVTVSAAPTDVPREMRPPGRRRLECNEWARAETAKGRTIDDLLPEYEKRYTGETGETLTDPRESLRQAVRNVRNAKK